VADVQIYQQDLERLNTLVCEGRYDDARELLLSLKPNIPEHVFLYNWGFVEQRTGNYPSAISHYEAALRLLPNEPTFHYGLATALLAVGDFERGWKEFDWRLRVAGSPLPRGFAQPQWDGRQPLAGRTILLHTEGGFGDAIQFCRYVPMVAARGARVFLECRPRLYSLFRSLQGVSLLLPRGAALPPFDYHCPLQSLPAAFGTTLESIPNRIPYLSAPPALREQWERFLGQSANTRAGLTWRGSDNIWPRRSKTLTIFAPLASIVGVEFHGIQVGPGSDEAPPPGTHFINHAPRLSDFGHTAALVSLMDLVISVDTGVAHLAGAMAKPVWVLQPKDACYRYLLERTDSPWYPTMRLYRQATAEDDWQNVVARIAADLAEFCKRS
jgi:hypothetical protein